MQELKHGSYTAFNLLYEMYFDLLYGFVFGLIRSHTLAEEIVQDTFIKVWLYKNQINLEYSFKSWIYRIAKNQVIDNFRKQLSQPLFDNYIEHCEHENLQVMPHLEFDFDLFRASLASAKQLLSPRQLEIFELCKEQNLSPSEAAEKLKLSKQVVYNYLSQALEILRRNMKDVSFP